MGAPPEYRSGNAMSQWRDAQRANTPKIRTMQDDAEEQWRILRENNMLSPFEQYLDDMRYPRHQAPRRKLDHGKRR